MDMRDADDDVTSRTIHLIDTNNANAQLKDVTATVYGMERQPFITQVYATDLQYADGNNIIHNGFVAVELYNPYPVPLDLSNYTLAFANRPTSAGSPMNLTFTPIPWAGTGTAMTITDPAYPGTAPVIPPNSSIIIASGGVSAPNGGLDPLSLPPTGAGPPSANLIFPPNVQPAPATWVKPPAGQVYLYVLTGLCPQTGSAALGNELYLLRGRLENSGSTADMAAAIKPAPLSSWNGTAGATTQPSASLGDTTATAFTEGIAGSPNPADMVPADSYDFSNLYPSAGFQTTPGSAHEWYYVRPNPMGAANKAWHFVYPGHLSMTAAVTALSGAPLPRLWDGTIYSGGPLPGGTGTTVSNGIGQALANAVNIKAAITSGTVAANELPFGMMFPTSAVEAGTATGTYQDIPLELNSPDFGGPNAGRASTYINQLTTLSPEPIAFPFGGFARNGDILEVPYIGAYRLTIPAAGAGAFPQVIEMNSPTMDSVMALATAQPQWGETPSGVDAGLTDPIYGTASGNNFAIEQVGRFCPIGRADALYSITYRTVVDDFWLPPSGLTISPTWLYHWSTRLFDYLTVQSPQLDLLPDVDPGVSDPNLFRQYFSYPVSTVNPPVPVANSNGAAANAEPNSTGSTEEAATVQGLININTAPWRVLAAVPWVPAAYPNHATDNVNIALSIAYYRDVDDGTGATPVRGHGPFKSIFELSNVPLHPFLPTPDMPTPAGLPPLLRDFFTYSTGANYPFALTSDLGDLTAVYGNTMYPVLGDFKSQYMMINRVSNLITTRSDSFTAYVLLQGWRAAETPNAALVVQRRAAFLIDRSGVTPINSTPTVNFVPSQ
jgi:hypothetical protein